jgi:hypothetical protein
MGNTSSNNRKEEEEKRKNEAKSLYQFGYPDYWITENGEVYRKKARVSWEPEGCKNLRSAVVQLIDSQGKISPHRVDKLVALTWISLEEWIEMEGLPGHYISSYGNVVYGHGIPYHDRLHVEVYRCLSYLDVDGNKVFCRHSDLDLRSPERIDPIYESTFSRKFAGDPPILIGCQFFPCNYRDLMWVIPNKNNIYEIQFDYRNLKWRSSIIFGGGKIFLGHYNTEIEAEEAKNDRMRKMREVFGNFTII